MKRTIRYFLAAILVLLLLMNCFICLASAEGESGEVIVLYTNDIHCSTEHYATLAAYRAELIREGNTVITVDAGDAIQGEMIGSLTRGEAIIEIMNAVGYDFAVPGNHEFDYKVDTFLELAAKAEHEYICCNFYDEVNEKDLLAPYKIVEAGGERLAFVGIATPETYSKSTPTYFQNENGEFIYTFKESEFYLAIQRAVDSAVSEGADRVIAIAHLGIGGVTEGWRSSDVIANTEGIDALIDGHAHEVIESALYPSKDGADVALSSTGTKFNYIGKMTISEDGITTELINPDSIDVSALSDEAQAAYGAVDAIVSGYNAEFDYLFEEIGFSEAKLSITDENGKRLVRSGETNMANFVTDAYRAVFKTDIAFVNGGGVRAEIEAGAFNRKAVMDVNPWSNETCILEVTGQQIVDALEYGTHASPEEYGSFPHVSGITFELHTYIDSAVVIDELDNFVSIDENAPRRVRNVKVNGVPIDLSATYTLSGSQYMLLLGGYTMFKDAKIIAQEGLPTDTEALVEYVEEHLNGVIPAERYRSIYGEGRMTVISEPPSNGDIVPGDESNALVLVLISLAALTAIKAVAKNKSR